MNDQLTLAAIARHILICETLGPANKSQQKNNYYKHIRNKK